MGGQALKIAKTRRFNSNEYFSIKKEVEDMLASKGFQTAVPASFATKPSFGDLDILVLNDAEILKSRNIRDIIVELFQPTEMYPNGSIYSFDYKEFQIDIILVSPKDWITSQVYFSFNDLGNFMGRIAYQMGFRYGDYGLKLVYRHEDGGRKFEYIVSKSPEKIFEFLGFDWSKYMMGFDTVEDIFEFIIESKYFSVHIFQYDQLNHQNRTRNKKRKNYASFLDYIQQNDKKYVYASKEYYVDLADEFFSINLKSKIDEWKKTVEIEKQVSRKFNGEIVMQNFSLTGKELGDAIGKFHEFFNYKHDRTIYNEWILTTNQDKILEKFAEINNL